MLAYQQTGLLTAEVLSGVMGLRGPCRIELVLKGGRIVLCTLIGTDGGWLTGKDAEQALIQLGRLRWTFTAQSEAELTSPDPQIPVSVTNPKFFIPQRLVQVEQGQMRNWPRTHRLVFALVDGTKNVTKIAEILSISSDIVEKTLSDLQSIGVIAFGRQGGKDRM